MYITSNKIFRKREFERLCPTNMLAKHLRDNHDLTIIRLGFFKVVFSGGGGG